MTVKADEKTMLAHLQYMFGGLENHELYSDGLMEVGTLEEVRFFPLNKMEKAARYAVRRTEQGSKVYVHCGLIKSTSAKVVAQREGRPTGHSGADGVLCWPVLWGEADHKHLNYNRVLAGEARNDARLASFEKVAQDHGLSWGWISATGTVPSLRLQGFIRLDEPAAPNDPKFWQVLKSVSRNGPLDIGANNSSQVLRLCGSVSFAGASTKKDEAGEAPRVDEAVTCIACRDGQVNLAETYQLFDMLGLLSAAADAPTPLIRVKSLDALAALVRPPENAPTFERDRVREAVQHVVQQASTADVGRRDAVLRAAKTVGGMLWTGAFDPAEIVSGDDGLDDDDANLSLVTAYELSGGANDNGSNAIDRGIIDAMASGAAAPLSRLPLPATASDGAQFGAVTDEDDDARPPGKPREALVFETFDEVADTALVDNATPLVEGWQHMGAMSVVYGNSNTGKSFVALHKSLCIATGRLWAGFPTTQGLVVYVAAGGGLLFKRRVLAIREELRVAPGEAKFALVRSGIDLRNGLRDAQALVALVRAAEARFNEPCALVIIDTLSRAMAGGDENSSVDMGSFVRACDHIRHATGAHLEIVHHTGKDKARGARGHSLLRAATDSEIEVVASGRNKDGWSTGRITATKQRDLEFAPPLEFALKPVRLGAPNSQLQSAVAIVTPARAVSERSAEGETVALVRAVAAEGHVTLRALGKEIGKSAATAGRCLNAAAAEGLIVRVAKEWRVTAAGRKLVAAADEAAREAYAVVEPLDEAA